MEPPTSSRAHSRRPARLRNQQVAGSNRVVGSNRFGRLVRAATRARIGPEKEVELREKARKMGRKEADKRVRRIDPVFTPRKLNPDDAKVMFHPIDYVVFDGLKQKDVSRLVLLDRKDAGREHRAIQRKIEKAVEKQDYDWMTLRVGEDGSVERD